MRSIPHDVPSIADAIRRTGMGFLRSSIDLCWSHRPWNSHLGINWCGDDGVTDLVGRLTVITAW